MEESDIQINVAIPPLSQLYTYRVPHGVSRLSIGSRVEVPLGRRNATGFVISLTPERSSEREIKDIIKTHESFPSFTESQLKFFERVAQYYGDTLSTVIDVAVPPAALLRPSKTVRLIDEGGVTPRSKVKLQIIEDLKEKNGTIDYVALIRRGRNLQPALKGLIKAGLVRIEEGDPGYRLDYEPAPSWAKRDVELNFEQQNAFERIRDEHKFKPFLLYGVTGSGKTEVYLKAIREVRNRNRTAIVIVPEIALTPQLTDRFRAVFGEDVAILHSGLKKHVRWDYWRALIDQKIGIVIGARSAVFAPLRNVGLIIVDEEHDTSFKQSEGLRYNGRDLAVLRAQFEECPVVLGSATPSLESFHHASTGKYELLQLPYRPDQGSHIDIEVVDMNRVKPWDMPSKNISPVMLGEVTRALEKGEQVFMLYNRRGFSSYLQCSECEHVIGCPNCSVTFTYHQANSSLLCHYCGLSVRAPKECEPCSKTSKKGELVHRGAGTEKVFEELQSLFPGVPIERLDRDAADNIEKYKAILKRVRDGEVKILVGTQMIAKGHDLPEVTLVGVVDCDVGLHMPDFRAGERVFQLLTQASGRAGRGLKPGKVVLQTRVPRHPSIVRTITKDFLGFAREELTSRKVLQYPPYTRLLRIVASSHERELPVAILNSFRKIINQVIADKELSVSVLGPSPAPLSKIKAQYRFHMILKGKNPQDLNRIMLSLQSARVRTTKVKIVYDMDPQEMM